MKLPNGQNLVNIVRETLNRVDPRLVDHGERVAYLVYKMLQAEGESTPQVLQIPLSQPFFMMWELIRPRKSTGWRSLKPATHGSILYMDICSCGICRRLKTMLPAFCSIMCRIFGCGIWTYVIKTYWADPSGGPSGCAASGGAPGIS